MKAIPIIGVLILNRGDLLKRLFDSIDYPYDKFMIINNGKDRGVIDAAEEIRKKDPDKVIVIHSPKNTGVAAGWNQLIKSHTGPWTLIVGNDIQFTPGDLEKMATEIWNKHKQYGKFFTVEQGHNAHAITELALEKVGFYDENFYPAYLEDCDYQRRMVIAEVPWIDIPDCHIIHGEPKELTGHEPGSSTIYSNPKYRIANIITHGNGFNYYMKKWGGINEHERYTHPFNNPKLGPKDWTLDPELRVMNDVWGV